MSHNKFYSTDSSGSEPKAFKKVLRVEDDEFCAYTVLKLMKKDFEFIHRFSGYEGIEEARKNKFDLLLLDIGLKDINGIEVLNHIKNIPGYEDVPAIAVTAFAMLGDKEKFLNSGFTYYIAKPYNVQEFKDLMYKAIGIQQS